KSAGLHRRLRSLLALVPLAAVLLVFAVDRWQKSDRVLRGVELDGRALTGLDRQGVEGVLATLEGELRAEPLLVKVQAASFELAPERVGLAIEQEALLSEALAAGREGNVVVQLGGWLRSFWTARPLTPACRIDERALDELLADWEAEGIEDPPFEGAVLIEGTRATEQPPRQGHAVDRSLAATAIVNALCARHRTPLELPLVS